MSDLIFTPDAFGDRFELGALPLPRPPAGYAVQMLGTDKLLDRQSGDFLPVRSTTLHPLFESFDSAYSAARQWVETHNTAPDQHRLAIVPAGYDAMLERHILIYGVLCEHP
jgi:hypothetical protein